MKRNDYINALESQLDIKYRAYHSCRKIDTVHAEGYGMDIIELEDLYKERTGQFYGPLLE